MVQSSRDRLCTDVNAPERGVVHAWLRSVQSRRGPDMQFYAPDTGQRLVLASLWIWTACSHLPASRMLCDTPATSCPVRTFEQRNALASQCTAGVLRGINLGGLRSTKVLYLGFEPSRIEAEQPKQTEAQDVKASPTGHHERFYRERVRSTTTIRKSTGWTIATRQ